MTTVTTGVQIGSGITFTSEPLYPFTTFTFQTGGMVGSTGPNTAWLFGNSYTSNVGNTWLTSTNYYSVDSNGFQYWTVPASGNYQITVAGARAGLTGFYAQYSAPYYGSGLGAVIRATVPLQQGQVLAMAVGQMSANSVTGANYSTTGGGGGTFVYSVSPAVNVPILVAGGGGGPGCYNQAVSQYYPGGNAVTTISGGTSYNWIGQGLGALGGTNGQGGSSHATLSGVVSASGYEGGGGGGWFSTGVWGGGTTRQTTASGNLGGGGGGLFSANLIGGTCDPSYATSSSNGGFGGGGGSGAIGGGGGGGFSGGAGNYNASGRPDGGGGGGSYIIPIASNVATSDGLYNGSNVFVTSGNIAKIGTTGNTAYNNGPGYVTITKV